MIRWIYYNYLFGLCVPKLILMPALSPTMQSGNLAKWLVGEGQEVKSGDVIAEIETDKSVMELESSFSGKFGKILVAAGTRDVAVNIPIAVLLSDGESVNDIDSFLQKHGSPAKPCVETTPAANVDRGNKSADKKVSSADTSVLNRVKASPVAKKIARAKGIDLNSLHGTGPGNRIIKDDVVCATPKPEAAQANEFEVIPASNMRRIIAARLLESKTTVPHFYLEAECIIDDLSKMRETLNIELQAQEKPKLTINDFIVKAVALALRKNPDMNASWQGESIIKYRDINVCVAVAIDGGLVTPVIRMADKLGIADISNTIKLLALKARQGKITPEDLTGGTFTISNLGMYGIPNFSAIINAPQAAILAVGAGVDRPVVKDGAIAIANVMSVTLSVDHRVVDGALGAQFLSAFKMYIEKPALMLI